MPIPESMHANPKVRRLALLFLGLAALAGLLVFADPKTVVVEIAAADPDWIAMAVVLILLSTVIGAANSFAITGSSGGFLAYTKAYWAAWAVGLVVPGQVGDVVTLSAYLGRHGFPLHASLGRVGTDKLVSLMSSLAVSTQLFRLSGSAWVLSISTGAGILLGCLLVLLVFATGVASRVGSTRFVALNTLLGALLEARCTLLERPVIVLLNVLLTSVKILVTGAAYLCALRALGAADPEIGDVTIAAISAGIVAYVPVTANGIGLVEATGVSFFGLIAVPFAITISTYLILRFINLALAWIPVGLYMLYKSAAVSRRNTIGS